MAENRYKRAEKVFPISLGPSGREFESPISDHSLLCKVQQDFRRAAAIGYTGRVSEVYNVLRGEVPKLGPKAFEQCAGFLRVPESRSILDNTGVHPESYGAARQLLALCGYTLEDARNYCIIGCVEPQACAKTDGWHDAAFFNMLRPLELVFSNGVDKGEQIGPRTGDVLKMTSFEEFYKA